MEYHTCFHCSDSLTGKRYVIRQDKPTCLTCYDDKFADRCEACGKPISTEAKQLSYRGRHWHEECFRCWSCQGLLGGEQFVGRDEGVYCNTCFDKNFALRCDGCNKTFKHGQQKFDYNGRRYHDNCFICSICQMKIGNTSFIPQDEDRLVCMTCYNENFAQKCGKCNEVMTKGGITFRDVTYHKDCFNCTKCKTPLAHLRFGTKEDRPYCPDCFVKTFARQCEACQQPIAGLGKSAKYVSFDKRTWHTDCFNCTKCNKTVLGLGFLNIHGKIYCPDCGKNV